MPVVLLLAACAGTEATKLTVTPAGPITVSSPTTLRANLPAKWTASAGTVSTASGSESLETTYSPPSAVPTSTSATVTATSADGQTATVTIALSATQAAIPGGKIAGMTQPASVEYDAEGIPHVFCQTAADCIAVQGFLHAQDRLFEMDFFRRTARAELATMLGSPGVSQDEQILAVFANRAGQRIETAMKAALDPKTKTLLDAYVSGVNAYLAFLAANPSLMPGEYAQLPGTWTPGDIPAWTEEDSLAIGRLQQFQLSETIDEETAYGVLAQTFEALGSAGLGRIGAYIRSQQPISDFTLSATDSPPTIGSSAVIGAQPRAKASSGSVRGMAPWFSDLANLHSSMAQMHEVFGTQKLGAGSNNWVVDAAHSATGKAMVANDPHLNLYYPSLFHLVAMTSAANSDNLDLAGGSFPGIPGALVGRGKNVGWGVTVVGYDVTDLYLETVNPTCTEGGGVVPCVNFGGNNVPMMPVQYTIKVRNGASVPYTVLVVPHHGPIVSYTPGATTGISMRWTGHEATDDFAAFLGLDTATAVGTESDPATATTAIGALKNYKVGAQNFVLADDAGNIGYYPHALVPLRPWAGQTDPIAGVPRDPWLPLPGYGSSEWGPLGATNCNGAQADASCFVPDAQLPQSVNPSKGYLATANSDPGGYGDSGDPVTHSNVDSSLTPNGVYLSFDWDDPTDVRYSRIAGLLAAKTKSGGKVSMADMQAIQSDHAMLVAKLFNQFLPPKASVVVSSTVTAQQAAAYGAAFDMFTQWATDGYDCPTGLSGISPSSAQDSNYTHVRDSAACLLFHVYVETLLQTVFSDDLAFVAKASGQTVGTDAGRQIRTMLYMLGAEAASVGASGTATPATTEFCSNITTAGKVTTVDCFTQEVTALITAYLTISADAGAPPTQAAPATKWLWGKYHTLTTTSPAAPLIAGGYQAGPFARPGGALTVDVGNPDGSQSTPLGQTYSHGSNVRFVGEMDPPSSANTLMQLPGYEHDQADGVFSSSPDLLSAYVQNQYFNYLMGHQVDANAVSTQGFAAP